MYDLPRSTPLFLLFLVLAGGCAVSKERKYLTGSEAPKSSKTAILILPGFGSKMHGTKKIASYFSGGEHDVFIPSYISRRSISRSVKKLDAYMARRKLGEYRELHVFSYIVGAWTLNQWILQHGRGNIRSIVYDRSPYQERAPFALVEDIPFIMRLVSGPVMEEFAGTPYPPIDPDSLRIGLLIEAKASRLVKKHRDSALRPGPVSMDYAALGQPHHDHFYCWIDHDGLYTQFDTTGKEILHFFNHGRFSPEANRKAYTRDPFE